MGQFIVVVGIVFRGVELAFLMETAVEQEFRGAGFGEGFIINGAIGGAIDEVKSGVDDSGSGEGIHFVEIVGEAIDLGIHI